MSLLQCLSLTAHFVTPRRAAAPDSLVLVTAAANKLLAQARGELLRRPAATAGGACPVEGAAPLLSDLVVQERAQMWADELAALQAKCSPGSAPRITIGVVGASTSHGRCSYLEVWWSAFALSPQAGYTECTCHLQDESRFLRAWRDGLLCCAKADVTCVRNILPITAAESCILVRGRRYRSGQERRLARHTGCKCRARRSRGHVFRRMLARLGHEALSERGTLLRAHCICPWCCITLESCTSHQEF